MAEEREEVRAGSDGARLYVPQSHARSVQTGMNVMQALVDEVNGGNALDVAVGMLAVWQRSHRYLQNEAIIAILSALTTIGSRSARTHADARNRWALDACACIKDALDDARMWVPDAQRIIDRYSYPAYCEEQMAEDK